MIHRHLLYYIIFEFYSQNLITT